MVLDAEAVKGGDIIEGIGLGGFNIGTIGTVFIWIFVIIFIVGIIAGICIWLYTRKLYSQEIWVFGKVGGVPMLKYMDKGRLMPFGMAGDRLLRLKKSKKFLPPPRIQMGKKIWWFYEREDGEFINFSLEDLDDRQKKAGAYYVDTDMRMQRLGIEKNLRERMEKKGFFEKYGQTIAGVIFVIMVTVSLVVLFSKLKDVAVSMDGMASSVNGMANAVQQFYTERVGGESPADLGNGVSGLVSAFAPLLIFWRSKWLRR